MYDDARCEGTFPKIIGNYDLDVPEGTATGAEGAFAVSKGAVGIVDLLNDRKAVLVNADPNSNLVWRGPFPKKPQMPLLIDWQVESRTVIPTLRGSISRGETKWYACGAYAKPSGSKVPKESYLDGWQEHPRLPKWVQEMINV